MSKKIIFLAGLPACGKDTVANYFKNKGYFSVSFSSDILKPIIKKTNLVLAEFLRYSLGRNLSNKSINKAVLEVENEKKKCSGRELYINVGVNILPRIVKELSRGKFLHFNVFCKKMFESEEKIIIASFRMIEEIKTLQKLYPDAKFIKILIKSKDNIRYERIKNRDKLDFDKIIANEKYERETTYDKIIKEVNFDYEIINNESYSDLIRKIENLNIS